MLQVNQIVLNKKGQKGIITRIITKSTGYVEVSYDGILKKEMAFNLTDEQGNAIRKAPRKQEPKPLSPLEEAISAMKWINGTVAGDRNSISYKIWADNICKIELAAKESGNTFIESVCHTVDKYMTVSDKQAYCLAKFSVENNIKF